jgi:hypothetical protein
MLCQKRFLKIIFLAGFTCLLTLSLALPAQALSETQGLEVVSLMPQGEVDQITQVVVRFNKDMIPLGQAAQSAADSPLLISPLPKGSFRWLDTKTLAFILDKPIRGATRLDLAVIKKAKSLKGETLAKEVTAKVSTPSVEVVEWRPKPGSTAEPKPVVRAVINQPVDIASLSQKTFFIVQGKKLAAKVSERELPRWQREENLLAREYVFSCPQKLEPGQKFKVLVEPGVTPADGDLSSSIGYGASYKPFYPLRLNSWNMNSSPFGGLDPDAGLNLKFTNPVSRKEVEKHIQISPRLPELVRSSYDYQGRWHHLALDFQPRTRYTVTITKGLKDIYGTKLAQDAFISLKTGDLAPTFHLPEGPGVLEAKARPLYPLRLRNIEQFRLGLRYFPADQAVKVMEDERTRPWNQTPRAPALGQKHAVSKMVTPNQSPNQLVLYPIDLEKDLGRSLRGGLTLIDLRATWPDYKGRPKARVRRALLQYTDLGLSLKLGDTNGLAWVTSLSTGLPLKGASLELRDRKNRVLWQGISNEQGLAEIPGITELKPAPDTERSWRNPVVYLLARHQGELAITPSEFASELRSSMPYEINQREPGQISQDKAHALFQLPLYQPGQKVNFTVFVRRPGPMGAAPPPVSQIKAWINNPYGKRIKSFEAKTNKFGTFAGSCDLPAQCRLGEYELILKINEKSLRAGSFRVASFRPPDFKIKLSAPKDHVGAGSPGQARVKADYLFGKPVTQGQVKLMMNREEAYFQPPLLAEYAVGDIPLPDESKPLDPHVGVLTQTTGQQGDASFDLPGLKAKPGAPLRLELTAEVSDPSNRVLRSSSSILIHPAELYLGLKAPLLARAGKPAKIQLAAATRKNQPASPGQVHITAYRQYWESVREKGEGGYYRYLTRARRTEVWQKDLAMNQSKTQFNFTPPESGTYVLVASAKDSKGFETKTGLYIWASGQGLSAWKRYDDNRLDLVLSTKEAKPGETVKVMLKNPFGKATALLTVERQGVRKTLVKEVAGPGPVLEVPLEKGDAPGVYLSVLLVRGRVGEPKPNGADLGKPQVRIGCAELKVNQTARELEVQVRATEKNMRPGQKAEVFVDVTLDNTPHQSQVTLLAVDERVLVAAGKQTPYDPRPTFDKMQPLSVLTADLRTAVVSRVLGMQKGESAAGGGGMGSMLRKRFTPTVFWLAQADTGPSGGIVARFPLPDSLTSYRIVAVVCDKEGRFGLGQEKITASQPLQLLSALPRFARLGDRFQARVLVQNLSDAKGKAQIQVQGKGLLLEGAREKVIDLMPNQTKPVDFTIKVIKTGQVSLTFEATLGDFKDQVRFSLPVKALTRLETMADFGSLLPEQGKNSRKMLLSLPSDALSGIGGLKITLSPSLAAGMTRPATMLLDYPWDCLEQRLSRGAARAMRLDMGPGMGLSPHPTDHKALLDLALAVPDFQSGNGGFTYWPGWEKSDPFVTAYALLAGSMINKSGVRILSEDARQSAADYLMRYLRRTRAPQQRNLAGRSQEAFIIWVLAREGFKVVSRLDNALTRTKGLDPFGLACLIRACDIQKKTKARAGLIKQLEASANLTAQSMQFVTVDPGGLKPVLGSELRGNAMALWALSLVKPAYSHLDQLAWFVANTLGSQKYISTQEAIFGLWALAAYTRQTGDVTDLEAKVSLEAKTISERHFEKPTDQPLTVEVVRNLLSSGQELMISADGKGRLLYSARLSFAPNRPAETPVNAGVSVSRFFQAAQGGEKGRWDLGQDLECVITVITQAARHHLMVEAPYPAGLEPSQAAKGEQSDMEFSPWRYKELGKTALLLYAPRLEPGVHTYRLKLRAIAQGEYVLPPARAEEMYSPEVFGQSEAGSLTVK